MPGPLKNRIKTAVPEPDRHYGVRLIWNNGVVTVADFDHLAGCGVFEAFRDRTFFNQVRPGADGYTLEWPDGLDFSADSLWFTEHPQDNPFTEQPSSNDPRKARARTVPHVESSAISRVEYDPESKELFVTFKPSGETYTYFGVPPEIYQDFLDAPSLGAFFNSRIRDSYEHARHR